ncbi:AN1-type zinc finger protein 4-like [Maniola hyperantus]|uniref:AN1-type zinc finger protein 4-like n=1 Tax=Aphantopus hyperantus TaxID=2795564 RepID=UPI001568E589|nr:AN1-type zinc finger protein 4-like [Maniola hyperantus]
MSQHGCPERLSNRSKGFQEDGASQPTMEVLVETLTGTAFEMTVSPSDTIFAIKSKIFRVEGIPVSQQHLLYNLRELDDALSLKDHAIGDGARLRLVLGLRGGPVATRRLPQPEPWRDIERLLHSNRDESEWGSSGSGSGCKATVLVFREGERVNLVRVRENKDGTYSPLDHAKYSSSLSHLVEAEADEVAGALHENAVTMGKMLDLRRRMESLSVQRRALRPGEKHDIQKTRSEETLSVPSLLDDGPDFATRTYNPYSEAEDMFAPLYDGNYTRYDYDCSFADRYTLLPPIGTRTDSDQSIQDAVHDERLKLSDALAGSILVKAREGGEEAAILEECLDSEECLRQDSPPLTAKNLAPIPAAEYGPLVGGEAGGWRARGFGSSTQLGSAPRSASALPVRAARHAPRAPPLSDALFSSSTSDLEKLKRNRILPALSRHRNREHLHLSDEGLDLSRHSPPRSREVGSERRQRRISNIAETDAARLLAFDEPKPEPEQKPEKKIARIRCGLCKKRLSIATVHKCRCGAEFCAPHRYAEVHGCAYDYKAHALHYLQQANPLVSAPKLPKI